MNFPIYKLLSVDGRSPEPSWSGERSNSVGENQLHHALLLYWCTAAIDPPGSA